LRVDDKNGTWIGEWGHHACTFKCFGLKYVQKIPFQLQRGTSCKMSYVLKLIGGNHDIECFVNEMKRGLSIENNNNNNNDKVLYSFIFLPKSLKANYNVSTSKQTKVIHKHKKGIKQGNAHHSDNNHSITSITPTKVR
jgi:hypothetical protein